MLFSSLLLVFLFLLINLHVIAVVVLLYIIIRQSIKLFVELHRNTPGSKFKRNLLFAFTVFSVMPSFLVFFIAGKFIATSIGENSSYVIKATRHPVYWSYLFTFILVTLLILFLSIWCAFYLAKGISRPIQELLNATEKIRKGFWDVTVSYDPNSDLKNLSIGFNEMTKVVQHAHNQLEQKNKEMLMILENINAAVFFVNKYGRILTYNSASKELVAKYLELSRFKNKKINFFGPQVTQTFASLVRELISSEKRQLTKELSFTFKGDSKTLLVHLTYLNNSFVKLKHKKTEDGLLIVIEDLTDLVKINKIKTWQQAAKQMAHEIKNPLTPIQLATQRLQRKFHKTLDDDKVFLKCTDTILNHVKIIKDLVSHFSEFAKMPSNNFEPIELNNVIKEVTRLYEISYPEINFIYELEEFIPLIKIDKKKIKRVVINLLDNSVRALKQMTIKTGTDRLSLHNQYKKIIKIKTDFKTTRNQIELIISDNGPGIPAKVKNKLFMPYVSSEKKNMGLGLAIVHDTITNIGGNIKLLPNLNETGAAFQILLPV